MSRPRAAKNTELKPWLSGNRENKDNAFIQLGCSFWGNEQVQSLTGTALRLYLCMTDTAGKSRDFQLSKSTARDKYGIAPASFSRAVNELVQKGFIERVETPYQYETAKYRFVFGWKSAYQNDTS